MRLSFWPSFRLLLLVGFLLIAGLLSAASLGGLYSLEQLTTQSREAEQRALRIGRIVQQLGENGVAMERAARQYLVLDERSLRLRFNEAAAESRVLLGELQGLQFESLHLGAWRAQLDRIQEQLDAVARLRGRRPDPGQALIRAFRELELQRSALAEQAQEDSLVRDADLRSQLEKARVRLGQWVLGSFALAILLSLVFGLWLTRPLRRLEQAIVALGENRLDQAVHVPGPADLRELGVRLDWLRLRLAELDADKARFLRHVSHELKTPLASMREGVALLEDGVPGVLSTDQAEVVRILRNNTAALQQQIEDLLRFNAAAFEARQLQRRPTELADLIGQRVQAQALQWQAKRLRVEIEGGPLVAEVDTEKFGLALANLLLNAIRFSPDGGCIRIALGQDEKALYIEIRDQGPGVAATDRDRIFEPFFRGERQPADGLRGSGIGLSIVQEYVQAHGGRIELLPAADGAHFRISLNHATT